MKKRNMTDKMVSATDKNKLLVFSIVLGLIAIIMIFFFGTRYVPLRWIGIGAILVEYLYAIPLYCGNFYLVHEAKLGVIRFVPIINLVQTFRPIIAIATFVMFLIEVLCVLLVKCPITWLVPIVGESAAMNVGPSAYLMAIGFFILLNIIIGIGLMINLHYINNLIYEQCGASVSKGEFAYYVLLLLPIVRVCPLLILCDKLHRLYSFGCGTKQNVDDIVEE